MLIPAVALAQPAITPADGTANIAVAVWFDDGNFETPVDITLKCTTGDYNGTPVELDPASQDYDPLEQIYVIDGIPQSQLGNVCTVKQSPVDGYETKAECYSLKGSGDGDPDPDQDCNMPEKEKFRLSYCQFNDVNSGEVGYCELTNYVLPVDVEVTKEWDISGFGGANYDRFAEVTIGCDAEIEDGYQKGNKWYITFDLYDDEYVDEEGDDVGMATVTAMVYPEWFKTANDPKKQKSTECWAGEPDVDSAVEVESDCGTKEAPGMSVTAGNGDSCTISNTLFFEGIPTLNQYGMAIMALLMLSVGFVGFRRFV
jgi:hypothetical protein